MTKPVSKYKSDISFVLCSNLHSKSYNIDEGNNEMSNLDNDTSVETEQFSGENWKQGLRKLLLTYLWLLIIIIMSIELLSES